MADQFQLLTECFVPFPPKTKGSMRSYGRTAGGKERLVQDVVDSEKFADMVTHAVKQDRQYRGLTEPFDGSVAVRCIFWVTRPVKLAGWSDIPATWTRAGDLDKLLRNVLDALTKAGVYNDDNQVDSLREPTLRVACRDDEKPGAMIQAWGRPPWDVKGEMDRARSLRRYVEDSERRAMSLGVQPIGWGSWPNPT